MMQTVRLTLPPGSSIMRRSLRLVLALDLVLGKIDLDVDTPWDEDGWMRYHGHSVIDSIPI